MAFNCFIKPEIDDHDLNSDREETLDHELAMQERVVIDHKLVEGVAIDISLECQSDLLFGLLFFSLLFNFGQFFSREQLVDSLCHMLFDRLLDVVIDPLSKHMVHIFSSYEFQSNVKLGKKQQDNITGNPKLVKVTHFFLIIDNG